MGTLTGLAELNASRNPLASLPKTISGCYSLRILDLSCCSLARLPEGTPFLLSIFLLLSLLSLSLSTPPSSSLPLLPPFLLPCPFCIRVRSIPPLLPLLSSFDLTFLCRQWTMALGPSSLVLVPSPFSLVPCSLSFVLCPLSLFFFLVPCPFSLVPCPLSLVLCT